MTGDADIQVWLERIAQTQPAIIVPYIESEHPRTLQYQVRMVAHSPTGQAIMSQGGTITVQAGAPAALGRMSVTQGKDNRCFVELTLQGRGLPERRYRFSCSGQSESAAGASQDSS